MAIEGRRPKPTKLKLLAGNPGKRPLNTKEPGPRVIALPKPPAELSVAARKEWRRLGRQLIALGILTEIDTAAFAVFCQAWGRWLEAEANLKKYGLVIPINGELRLSPYLRIADTAMATILRAAPEFGMTASARSRIHVEQPKDEHTAEVSRFLA